MTTTYFHGGTVWTATGAEERTVMVRDGVIAAIGADAEAAASVADTVVDLEGGFLMPSFGDGHAHPIFGGLEDEGPALRACRSVAEIVTEVRRYAEADPELEWITGASYDGSLAEEALFDARWLDEAVADRPVMLRASDYHTVWVNSRALELAGIDSSTPDPELGVIPRRDDSTALGTLREWGAIDLVTAVMPPRSVEAGVRALERAGRYYLERGVTWVQDAWVEPADVDVYLAAAASGALTLRVNLAQYADPRRFADQLPGMIAARERVAASGSPLVTANTVKFFADGVVENETGALLEPYCSSLHSHGMTVWGAETLAEAVTAADAAGFQVHVHAIGDSAVRQALDAIDAAIAANGPRDRRPVIAHAQLVDDADLARFADLGVIANMQPLWAQLDALMNVLTVPRLGAERSARQYRMRSLGDTGARLAFGSDWPVSSGDPREGLAIAATRRTPEGDPADGWTPHEIVPMEAALAAYTSAVAHQAFADQAAEPWGRIVPGASADLVWLERDPRTIEPHQLPGVEVRETYLAGEPRLATSVVAATP